MPTQYYTASTLDGFIADPDHSLDWLFQFGEGMTSDYPEFIAGVGAIAMGSTTYRWLLDHMIAPGADMSQPWPYLQPTWVFTTRALAPVPGADVRFVRGDVRPVHEAMLGAAGGKNVWLVGGGELVGQFHDHGLLDEIIITIASVTLGAGAQVLPRKISKPPLRLVAARMLGPGFVQLRYEVPKPAR